MQTLLIPINRQHTPRVFALLFLLLAGMARPALASPLSQNAPPATTTEVAAAQPNAEVEKGLQLLASGEWTAALAAFTAAQQQFEQTANREGEAESWLHIGEIQQRLQSYAAAEEAYRTVLTLAETPAIPSLIGAALDGLGDLYQSQQQTEQAQSAYQRALRIWYDNSAAEQAFHTLIQLSTLYIEEDAFAEAQGAVEEAKAIADKRNDPAQQEAALAQNARLYQAQALCSYRDELAIWQALSDQAQQGATLHKIGLLLQAMERYEEALMAFDDEILLWRALDDRAAEAEAHYSMAIIQMTLSQPEPALDALDLALVSAQAAADQRLQAKILGKQGDLYQAAADYDAALHAYQDGAALWESLGDLDQTGNLQSNVGKVYLLQGQLTAALAVLTTARQNAKEAADLELEAKVLERLGEVYGAQQAYPKAMAALQDALVLWRAVVDPERTTNVLLSLGALALDSGDSVEAEGYLQAALTEAEAANDNRLRANVFDKLGDFYVAAAKPAAALTAYEQALTFWQPLEPLRAVNTLLNLSGLHLNRLQPAAALVALDKAQALLTTLAVTTTPSQPDPAQLLEARLLSRRGDVYLAQTNLPQALRAYEDALAEWRALQQPAEVSGVLVAIGRVLVTQGKAEEGMARFTEALDLARTGNNRTLLAKTLNSLGDAYLLLGSYEAALPIQQEALTIWQDLKNLAEQGNTLGKIGKLNTLISQQLLLSRTENGLVEPAEGATIHGVVTIKGVANHVAFQKWQLDLLLNGNEKQAVSIGISTKSKAQVGAFLQWDTTPYPNGAHKLRLRVVREGANYDEYFTTVVIQN